jgi:hypothetical protein
MNETSAASEGTAHPYVWGDPPNLWVQGSGMKLFVQAPRPVGHYTLGNNDLGHHFHLTSKPSRIERFFMKHLLGLTWADAA